MLQYFQNLMVTFILKTWICFYKDFMLWFGPFLHSWLLSLLQFLSQYIELHQFIRFMLGICIFSYISLNISLIH